MPKNNKDNQLVTKKILDRTIDKALEKQTKVILKAVDFSIGNVRKELKTDMGGLRKELKMDISSLKTDVVDLKIRTAKLEKKVDNNTEKIDKVLDQQDGIVKQLSDLKEEGKMGFASHKRHDEKIEDHEQRINNLEVKIQPAGQG